MPGDPHSVVNEATRAHEHLSWGQILFGGGAGAMLARIGLSMFRRWGLSDGLAAAEGKYRDSLQHELEAARARNIEQERLHDERAGALRAEIERLVTENGEARKTIARLEAKLGSMSGEAAPVKTFPYGSE